MINVVKQLKQMREAAAVVTGHIADCIGAMEDLRSIEDDLARQRRDVLVALDQALRKLLEGDK